MISIVTGSAIGCAFLIRIVVGLFLRPPTKLGKKAATALILITCTGLIIAVFESESINGYLEMRSWPAVNGTIRTSTVVEERAFRPEVTYEFHVNGSDYSRTTDLQMPPFGGRTSKMDAAQKLSGMYPDNSRVVVYYNPENPNNSRIKIGVPVENYLKLSFSFFLLCGGLVFLLCSYPRKKEIN